MKEDVGDYCKAMPFIGMDKLDLFSLSARQEADEVIKKSLTFDFSKYQIGKYQ